MRIGAVWVPSANAFYRAIYPLLAIARRGHELVWPADGEGRAEFTRLAGCEVVHVYRRADQDTQQVLAELLRHGTAITYDNDDDFTVVPKESPLYRRTGGLTGQRIFTDTVRLARAARCFTTTTEPLARKYRGAGVERVEVIDNHVAPNPRPQPTAHDGLVIGWVAGLEHRADADRMRIADQLSRLLAAHDHVRVESIGVNLGLPERYRNDREVPFPELPERMAGWDIGIAPLVDIPYNLTRSDIKLKEYAASGIPWLASPVGPYLGLGEAQGGRLVPDGGWFEALDRLVTGRRERKRLARKAKTWAKRQTIFAVADRWERVFASAADTAGAAAVEFRPRAIAQPGRRASRT